MAQTIDLPAAGLAAVSTNALATLRGSLLRDFGVNAAGYLQQAGYAGGDATYAAFTQWLADQGHAAPESLPVADFARHVSTFFADLGWGHLSFTGASPVATIDSADWIEADETADGATQEHPACHLGTGLLAAFFGRIAEQPLAVMEVECRATGAARCRFLLGGGDVMQRVWEGMAAGRSWEELVKGEG